MHNADFLLDFAKTNLLSMILYYDDYRDLNDTNTLIWCVIYFELSGPWIS